MEAAAFPAGSPARPSSNRRSKLSLLIPTPERQTRPAAGGGRGDSPPGSPADTSSVRELLREFNGGLCGEAFGGDRLLKIAVLGKGSTSTVWEAIDVDTLQVLAVKEMVVCDSKQTAVLEHELRVLNSQLQPLPGTPGNGNGGPWGTKEGSSSDDGSDHTGTAGAVEGRKGGLGGDDHPPDQGDFCPYMPRYFGSFLSEDDADGQTRVSIVEEHIPGGDLDRWIEEGALDSANAGAVVADSDSVDGGESGEVDGAGDPWDSQAEREYRRRERVTWPSLPSSSILTEQISNSSCLNDLTCKTNPEEQRAVLPSPPNEEWLARVCRDTLEALRHLHARRCIHRDVKPANVLLHVSGGARLADFGSTVGDEEGSVAHRMHGTIRFMSPERLCAQQCSPSSDLWSAGLTVAAAALGENPIPHCATEFEAVGHAEAAFDIVKSHPSAALLSDALMDFLQAVLVAEPDQRPTVETMLKHPFLLQVDEGGVGAGFQAARVGQGVGGITDTDSEGARRDPLRRLRNKRANSIDTPKEVIRRIVTKRRARRSRKGIFNPFSRGGAGGSVAQAPSPLRELDISHLASVLDVSVAELRSLFSCVNAELDESAYASDSSLDPSSASSACSSLSPVRTLSGHREFSYSPRRESKPGLGSRPRAVRGRSPRSQNASRSSSGSHSSSSALPQLSLPAAKVGLAPQPGRTNRFANWHRGADPERNSRSKSARSNHGGGRGNISGGRAADRGRAERSSASGGGQPPGTSSNGGGSSVSSGGVVGMWKNWSRSQRLRFKPARPALDKVGLLDMPRHNPSPLSKQSSFNVKTRPPSGLDDSFDLSMAAAEDLETPEFAERGGILIRGVADPASFSGSELAQGAPVQNTETIFNLHGPVRDSIDPVRESPGPIAAPPWGTDDAMYSEDDLGGSPTELQRLRPGTHHRDGGVGGHAVARTRRPPATGELAAIA